MSQFYLNRRFISALFLVSLLVIGLGISSLVYAMQIHPLEPEKVRDLSGEVFIARVLKATERREKNGLSLTVELQPCRTLKGHLPTAVVHATHKLDKEEKGKSVFAAYSGDEFKMRADSIWLVFANRGAEGKPLTMQRAEPVSAALIKRLFPELPDATDLSCPPENPQK